MSFTWWSRVCSNFDKVAASHRQVSRVFASFTGHLENLLFPG